MPLAYFLNSRLGDVSGGREQSRLYLIQRKGLCPWRKALIVLAAILIHKVGQVQCHQ